MESTRSFPRTYHCSSSFLFRLITLQLYNILQLVPKGGREGAYILLGQGLGLFHNKMFEFMVRIPGAKIETNKFFSSFGTGFHSKVQKTFLRL